MSAIRARVLWCAVLVLASVAGPPRNAAAQSVTGSIGGTVIDEQREVVPGASVTVIDEATGAARTTVTDNRGSFQLTNLAPGSYTIRVELTNFRTVERTRVILSAAERLSVGALTLTVGLGESIVVEASGSQVNTAETQHSGL